MPFTDLIREQTERKSDLLHRSLSAFFRSNTVSRLGMFAAVKRDYIHPLTVRTVSAQSSQVIRMFDAWIHGTVPRTIVNAFREAGAIRKIWGDLSPH
jgi:hypothetical protein